MKLQKVDDLLDVCVLLLDRDFSRLAKVRREAQGFTDGRRALVDIHLLGWKGI